MKLTKDGVTKEITKESVIDRMTRQGWVIEGEGPDIEEVKEAPKRRGRPPKEVTNGND